jgi:glycine/serine hydroxymethyltransferase
MPVPLVSERIFNLQNQFYGNGNGNGSVATKRVAIAGMVKSAVANQPLVDAKVAVVKTEKSVLTNQEGIFFFEDLRIGNYVLTVNCPGYLPQNVNVLVDSQNYTFKEILLTPE